MFLHPRPNDKKVVLNALDDFDGFQIGASVPASMMSFVRDVGRPFFVDPMLYMFTLPPAAVKNDKTGEIRASLSSLARRYGSLLSDNLGKQILTAADFTQKLDVLHEITQNVLEYQRTKLETGEAPLFNPYYNKYADLEKAGKKVAHTTSATTPWVLMPPFFYFDNTDDPWYTTTLACARLANRYIQSGEKLFPVIFTGRNLLEDPEAIKRVITDFSDNSFKGIFIWLNAVDEESAPIERLAGLAQLVAGLRAQGKVVFKLYGGYFSSTLHHCGLEGFSCSLNYRTSRNVFLYKWGAPAMPKPKFYIPRLHRVYPLEEADQLLRMFPFLRCKCGLCSETYGENPNEFITAMKKPSHCELHFLNSRRHELQTVQAGLPAVLEEFDDTLSQMKKDATGVRHLSRWRTMLRDIIPQNTTIEQPVASVTPTTLRPASHTFHHSPDYHHR